MITTISSNLFSRPFHGLRFGLRPIPAMKSLGYFQSSAHADSGNEPCPKNISPHKLTRLTSRRTTKTGAEPVAGSERVIRTSYPLATASGSVPC